MACPTVDITSAIDLLLQRKEKLHETFSELERKKAVLAKLGANWKDVETYLEEVEKRLRRSVQELASKEAALEVKMKASSEALEKRVTDVASREDASLVRVQEQKDAAVAIICELQNKHEAAQREESSNEEETSGDDEENATDEASPEQGVAHGSTSPPHVVDSPGKHDAGNDSQKPDHALSLSSLIAKETSMPDSNVEVKPRAQLKSLCKAMEAKKLCNFIADNRKDLNAISNELPVALTLAEKPAQLVLRALESYGSPEQSTMHGSKKDVWILSNKRACVVLLEALAKVLANPASNVDYSGVPEGLKKSAKKIADSWKSDINLDGDITSNVATDIQSFLQLVATFALASEYDQDELCKLVMPIARRKQMPSLCKSLDLSSKVPDLIEGLIKDGKQMEAITFATEFDLLERFQPVPLLKAYLRDARKAVQNALKGGNNISAAQNDANQKELSALKTVLKTISELKLEETYMPGPLEKRVAQLEKAKADRKRSAAVGKPQQMKRPRTSNTGPAASGMVNEKSFYRADNRTQYTDSLLPYGGPSQPVYDRHALGAYSAYGAAPRSPVSLQSSYLYSSDGLGALGYGASAYSTTPSATYTGYGYGTGLPTSYQSYH